MEESQKQDTEAEETEHRHWFPCRYILSFISSGGSFMASMLRFNLSVAMVAMVNNTETGDVNTTSEDCPNLSSNRSISYKMGSREFDWEPEMQGIILSSFYYGYVLTQIPSGWLAGTFGGKWLAGGSVLGMSILTMLTTLAARQGVGVLIGTRSLMGFFGGALYPSITSMLGKWSPIWERTKISAIAYVGASFGIIVAFSLTGLLCQYGFSGGWPSVFYVFGAAGGIWFILWCFLAYNTPEDHPRISKLEREYIRQSIGRFVTRETGATPWFTIFKSAPVWGVLVSGVCCTYGSYTLLTGLPSYMKEILKLDITQNGLLSSAPYLAAAVSHVGTGFVSDFLRVRGYLSTTRTRKLMITFGAIGNCIAFIVVSFVECDRAAVISLLVTAVALANMMNTSIIVNIIDLAPNYAGVLMGVCNTSQNLAGIAAPFVVGLLTNNQQTRETWGRVFYITAAVYLFGWFFYMIFGSGNVQPWATSSDVHRGDPTQMSGERTPLFDDGQDSTDGEITFGTSDTRIQH